MLQRETKRKQGSARDLLPISDFMSLFYRLADQHITIYKTAPFSYKAFRSSCEASSFSMRYSCTLLCLKSSQNYMGKKNRDNAARANSLASESFFGIACSLAWLIQSSRSLGQ